VNKAKSQVDYMFDGFNTTSAIFAAIYNVAVVTILYLSAHFLLWGDKTNVLYTTVGLACLSVSTIPFAMGLDRRRRNKIVQMERRNNIPLGLV
jgi:hypothetical protein